MGFGTLAQRVWRLAEPVRQRTRATSEPATSVAELRLHGPAVAGHSVKLRPAMRLLGAFQETLAAIALALQSGDRSLTGRVPDRIRVATDLLMVPQVQPGS